MPPQVVRDDCAASDVLPSARYFGRDDYGRPYSQPSLQRPVFILDSGASCHVAGERSFFSPPLTAVAATGGGTVSSDNFRLPDVLYEPTLGTAQIRVSVQQLAQLDYLVTFGSGQCSVKNRSSGELVGMGRLHDDDALYHLDYLKIPAAAAS
ncbi:hypothetical protein BS78_05G242500 [Paspalum vaginatum]|nr:hypothetical protein BS78_05G242500 [Paspalum vaginatum]